MYGYRCLLVLAARGPAYGADMRGAMLTSQVLLLEEVSMMSADTVDGLDFMLQEIRKNDLPFGGLQLIFCGDMAQCPPSELLRY